MQLPPEVRTRLDTRIVEGGYAGYDAHRAWLRGQGHRVSRSALQRYGVSLRVRHEMSPHLERVHLATARAKAILEELRARDDDYLVTDAALKLIQERIFEAVVEGAPLEDVEPLRSQARTLVDTTRVRTAIARERRQARADAADAADAVARRRGLSPAVAAEIRAAVEGAGT